MKISLEHAEGTEPEVIIRGDTNSDETALIISALRAISRFGKIILKRGEESFLYEAEDIIYFEAAQGRTCAVTDGGKYEAKEKLYELCESLRSKGFIQINKSTVVNINRVESISAEFSGNYTARLSGRKETLTISRKYFNSFKNFIGR